MKKPKLGNKIPYIDYECQVGERVQWRNLLNETFVGTIVSWNEDGVTLSATVKLDDDTLVIVPC